MAILCSSLFCGLNSSTSYAIDAGQKNDFFQVEVLSGNSSIQSSSTISYQYSPSNSANAYVYNVKDTTKFVLHFDFSDSATTAWAGTVPSVTNSKYTLNISVEFLKGYSSAYFTDENENLIDAVIVDSTSLSSTRTEAQGYQTFSSYTPNWNVHSEHAVSQKGETLTISGWGIYRFKMSLGGIISYSDFFILQPTMQVENAPTFTMYDNGIDEYTFNIIKTNEYQYIDENQIKWYVHGKTNDGKNYALIEDDLTFSKFVNLDCENYLYKTITRTGYSFTLQKPDLPDGEWTVWCEYTPYGSSQTTTSKEAVFTMGYTDAGLPYVWIIIGVCALSLGITGLFVFIKIKHEKIY